MSVLVKALASPKGRWRTVATNLAGAALVLFTLSFLPPDSSLADVQKSGILRVCLPDSLPPLVTKDPSQPGYDVELLQQVAADLGVRLLINTRPSIGADFNPRNWGITRAQCQIIAGGVVSSESTTGFLQLLETGVLTGWAQLQLDDKLSQQVPTVGIFPGTAALDRLALTRYLRSEKLQVLPVSSEKELYAGLQSGQFGVAIADRLTLSSFPSAKARISWVSESDLGIYKLAFGFWKGDSTLFQAVKKSLLSLSHKGLQPRLATRYKLPVAASDDP
jgi:ABC-type amino acid transport substrate-binding protein